ncbi:MAG: DUF1049 domain-containing protein [Acidobacteria bacterium]|nr:DUF1049 domain-containing protein [Acidobacteriota bacterium]
MSFKNIISFTLVIIFILFILLIAYNNDVPVAVNFKFLGVKEFTVPVSAVMVASFLIGLLVAFIWSLISTAVQSIETLTTKKRVKAKNELMLLYQEGLHDLLRGNYHQAEDIFKRVLKTDPKDLKALTAMGNVLRIQSKNHEAEEYHLKALLIEDNYLPALEGLFTDYISKNKWVLAKNTAEKILMHNDADVPRYKKELVKIYIAEKDWDEAIEIQNEVIKKAEKENKKEEQNLLTCLEYQKIAEQFEKEPIKDIERKLKKIIETDKSFVPAYTKLADYYIHEEDFANAFKTLNDGYIATREPVFIQRIETLYIDTNQPDDAIEYFKRLTEKLPNDVLPVFTLGKLYYKFEMLDQANSIFERIQAEVAYSPTLEYYIAKSDSKQENLENSIDRLKEIIRHSNILDITYQCTSCGHRTQTWVDRCPKCGCWNCVKLNPENELNELKVKQITPPRIDY